MVVASWYERRHTRGLQAQRRGRPRLDYDAEARVCELVDAPRQIRALDDPLAATKPLREGSVRTIGEARALDARRRARRGAQ